MAIRGGGAWARDERHKIWGEYFKIAETPFGINNKFPSGIQEAEKVVFFPAGEGRQCGGSGAMRRFV